VLRDRVYLVPSSPPDVGDDVLVSSWLRDGAAFYLKSQRRSGKRILSEWRMLRERQCPTAAHLIAAAHRTQLPIFASGQAHSEIEIIAPRRYEHAICDLLTEYMRLEDRAIETLLKYRLVKPAYWQFRLPPLPLEIFRRCKSVNDIPSAALEVRFEHSAIRRQFAEMNGLIADSNVHPRQKMKEIRKLESSLAAINRVADGESVITFANSGGYLLSSAAGGAQAAYGLAIADGAKGVKGGVELLKNAAAVAKTALGDRYRAWRLEPLHRSIDGYMRTSDQAMVKHVSRLFDHHR
jgi:hypothetical protein